MRASAYIADTRLHASQSCKSSRTANMTSRFVLLGLVVCGLVMGARAEDEEGEARLGGAAFFPYHILSKLWNHGEMPFLDVFL